MRIRYQSIMTIHFPLMIERQESTNDSNNYRKQSNKMSNVILKKNT
ncbi:hypothetical protein C4K27_1472 [Pseudomonas chlororaphis subsp. chlororaphis]|nr:hypothetical protein C4K27_1472 [Pseudomonas chlororaphis subsp. chlororaphis]